MSNITKEDLGKRDYVLVLDRSGSMSDPVNSKTTQSKWQNMEEAVIAVARKCQEFDDDGIDVYLFNTSYKKFENTTPEKVKEIFGTTGPNGGTNFTNVLTAVIDEHFRRANKPTTIIIATDGVPSNGREGQIELAKLIVSATKKLESGNELGIEFLQVGNDPEARDFLKRLDTELEDNGAKFDIVNTKTCDELADTSIEQMLLDAVNE